MHFIMNGKDILVAEKNISTETKFENFKNARELFFLISKVLQIFIYFLFKINFKHVIYKVFKFI